MVLYCPKCGKEIPEESSFCLFCGTPVRVMVAPAKKSSFPMAGGILEIIGACISIIVGLFLIAAFVQVQSNYYSPSYLASFGFLFIGVFEAVGFAFGLTSGILTLKRKQFTLSVVGVSLLVISGLITIIGLAMQPYGIWAGLLFGTPIIIISVLSLIFISISKKEFS